MSSVSKGMRQRVVAVLLAAGVALAGGGCERMTEPAVADAPPGPDAAPPGIHVLTESPPVTATDLDRLVGIGFTTDEIVSEIDRRGVLKRLEPSEREHIQGLPRGDRLLDVMESPKNLLSEAAVSNYGWRQAHGVNLEQIQALRQTRNRPPVYVAQAQAQTGASRGQLMRDYQRRRSDLSTRIAALKTRRTEALGRGETASLLTMEIERLEREQASLVAPL